MTPHRRQTVVSLSTRDPEETEVAGAALAAALPPATVVGLSGPLGAGKTCFARGLARGLGVEPALVASPTFIYLVDYPGLRGPVHHADLYRLLEVPADAAEAAYESVGLLAAMGSGSACIVEWWDHYRGPEPEALVRVEFVIENAEHRRLTVVFETPDSSRDAASFRSGLATAGLATSG